MKGNFGLRKSMVKRLTFYSVMLIVFFLLLTGLATIYVSHNIQKRAELRGLEKTAQQVAVGINSHLDRVTSIMGVFAEAQDLGSMDQNLLNPALNRLLIHQRRFLSELIVIGVDGKERARVSPFRIHQPSELADRSSSPEYQVPMTGRNYIGPVYISKQGNVPVAVVAVPYGRPDAVGKGALVAEVPLREMWRIVSEIEFGQTGYVYVVDHDGRLVAYKELSEMYQLFGQEMLRIPEVRRFIQRVPWDVNQDHEYLGLVGKQVIGSYAPVDLADWGVIVELPSEEAFAGIRRILVPLAVLLVAAVLTASITSSLLIKRITADLDRLRRGAEAIRDGDLAHEIVIRRDDELGLLAQVFNSMTSRLRNMVENLEQRVAERERAEAALRESESKYRNLVESTADWVWICDTRDRNTYSNQAVTQLLGYTPQEIFNKSTYELMHPDDRGKVANWFRRAVERKHGWKGSITRWLHKNGSVRYLESTAQPILDPDGQLLGFTGIDRDITERKRAQDILQESEERFRHLSELSPFGISMVERDGRYVYLNRRFIEIFGYTLDDIPTGKDWFRKAFPDPKQRHEVVATWLSDLKGAARDALRPREYVVTCKDGTQRQICFNPVTMKDGREFITYEDLTERKRIEEELLRIEKLESVGVLAGGIAHDFNNLLTGIVGYLSLAMMSAKPNDKMYLWLKEAEKAAARARELTQQLLTFSRGGAPVKKTASLHGVVADSCEFVLRGSRSRCEYDMPEDLWLGEIDEGQISQVIGNIVMNADQAMPDGGVIKVAARNFSFDGSYEFPLTPGRYIMVSIRDEGAGIRNDDLSKVFDPYFTTKPKGSGLGLAMVYSIVKKHDGHVTVESEPGGGAAFHLYLPASNGTEAPTVVEEKECAPVVGKAKVLLMDDEEIICQVAGEMLAHLGYEAHIAKDGAAALAMYEAARENAEPFDLVLMDLTIPGGMGGKETIGKLLEIDPEARAIVSSGYSNDPIMAEYASYGFRGVVSKPYRLADLAEVLYQVIGFGR